MAHTFAIFECVGTMTPAAPTTALAITLKTSASGSMSVASYDGRMQSLARVGTATAATLITGFLGGCIAFLVARILAEGFQLVEGPAAGVFLVLSVAGLAVVGETIGLIFSRVRFATSGAARHRS